MEVDGAVAVDLQEEEALVVVRRFCEAFEHAVGALRCVTSETIRIGLRTSDEI